MEPKEQPNDRARWEEEILKYEQQISAIKAKIALNKDLIKAWDKHQVKIESSAETLLRW